MCNYAFSRVNTLRKGWLEVYSQEETFLNFCQAKEEVEANSLNITWFILAY